MGGGNNRPAQRLQPGPNGYEAFSVIYTSTDLEDWERQITSKTRFVWVETPSNPTLSITDIKGLAEITKAKNIPLIVDNTLGTACLLKPLELGADIVVLSLTKYICGNGTIIGVTMIGKDGVIGDIVSKTLGYIGATMDPLAAWLTLMNLECPCVCQSIAQMPKK